MDNDQKPHEESRKRSGPNRLQLPVQPRKRHPSISRSDVKGKDGFIVDKNERNYFIEQFQNNASLSILNKNDAYSVPPGHPLHGKMIPFDIMKDNNGNIFAVNDRAKLGKGAFGNVVTIQCLEAKTFPAEVGGYYALKLQKPSDTEELNNIKKEMRISGKFGLVVGELEIQRGGETIYFSVMPLLAGNELAKTTPSYEGYEVKPIKIDPDKKAVREELGKNIEKLLWSQPSTPRTPREPIVSITVDPPQSPPESSPANSPSGTSQYGTSQYGTSQYGTTKYGTTSNTLVNVEVKPTPVIVAEVPKIETKTKAAAPLIADQKPLVTRIVGESKDFEIEKWLVQFQKMAAEIEKCHAEGVLHLDIKPENFMYDSKTGVMKVIDYGVSLPISEVKTTSPSELCQGTPSFMAPEFFKFSYQSPLSTKQDMYALGRSFELLVYDQMIKMTGHHLNFMSDLGPNPTLEKGQVYLDRDPSGQFSYTVMTPEGKWVTEALPRDLVITYKTPFGQEIKKSLDTLPEQSKISLSIEEGLFLAVFKYASEKGHLPAVPFPYERSLPPGILVTEIPPQIPKADLMTAHLINFRLENKHNDPKITAMNEMLELVHSMRNPDPASRPEASVVHTQLTAIQTKMQQQIEEKALLKQIIREAPQEKSAILQLRVINTLIIKHHREAVDKWLKLPQSQRGPKPIQMKTPSLEALKVVTQEVHNEIAKEKLQQSDDIKAKQAKEEYEKNRPAKDYALHKEIRLDLNKEISSLMIKRKSIPNTDLAALAHIDKILESKRLQLKNAEVEIRTYERKYVPEFELKINPLNTFKHLVQDLDKAQNTKPKEIVGHTNPAPLMFDDVNHHPHHHANNMAPYKQQINSTIQIQPPLPNAEIEKIKVDLQAMRDKLSNYKQHTDMSAQHQQNSMLGSALNFLGKVDKSDKSVLAGKLIDRVDGLLANADRYKDPGELNRKFLGVCQDGIDENLKLHKGKVSSADKSDLYDICNETKKDILSPAHLQKKK